MSTAIALSYADEVQAARAAHLRALLEPWSIRKLEAKTGIGRTALSGKLNGSTALTLADIEALAPLIRMTAQELASELFAIPNEKAPTPRGGGLSLPGLDSNQEPAGFQSALISRLTPRTSSALERERDAIVTVLRA